MFQGIFNIVRDLSQEPDFWSENRIFQKFLNKPQNMFRWCFLSVSRYLAWLSIVRNLSQEPDFWAKNQIFTNFSNSLKTCLVVVFWVFQGIFSIARHLSREPDFSAENQIFKSFLKKPQNIFSWCFFSVLWLFFLALFDIWAEKRIF